MMPRCCSLARRSKRSRASMLGALLLPAERDESEHGEVVAPDLLPLLFCQAIAARVGLVLHRAPPFFLQKGLKPVFAEGAPTRTADLIDQPIRGHVERITV